MFSFRAGIGKGALEILFCGREWGEWNCREKNNGAEIPT